MADLDDVELVAELNSYGENVSLPIKAKHRPILVKKLNHLRIRHKKEDSPSRKNSSKPASRSRNTRGSPTPTPPPSISREPSRYRSNNGSYDGPSNLEALSSDDSDTEYSARSAESSMLSTTPSTRPHNSSFADNVLRSIRRRATNTPSTRLRSGRRSEVLELSTERNDTGTPTDAESSSPSPARSKLYPDLSRFTSVLSSPSVDNFESSDSDGDLSTYSAGDKSINTSFPHHSRNYRNTSAVGSSSNSGNSSYSSLPLHKSMYARRYQTNGPGSSYARVQQYRSRFSELLPLLLVAIVALFFVGLSVTYVVKHKDFIFSWLSTSDRLGSNNNNFLFCKHGEVANALHQNCFTKEDINKGMEYIKDISHQLGAKKGAVMCHQAKEGDDVMKVSVLRTRITVDFHTQETADRIYRCLILHIFANPHWDLVVYKGDGTEATSPDDAVKLESTLAIMTFWCRLHRSFTQVVYGIIYLCFGIASAVMLYMYLKYHMKRRGQEQKEVYGMVEKIIDVLQEHYEHFKRDDNEESTYLAVQHVRDQLLPPAQRRQYQHIWDKAVDFIAANESRIRMETKIIRGEQFDVWYWLQPAVHNGKVWQGQAFGENNNNSNQVMYCPSPCLKIRNMFDSNIENEDNWEEGVIDAVLEKCRSVSQILHMHVDVDSKEGCVYMKCTSCEDAGRARTALNGWWFDGRLVTVKHLKTDHYHKRWPEARSVSTPLKPSTNQMKSLSQPFYRSSLEMT